MGTLSLGADFWAVLWPRFVQGFGMGFVFVPLTTMALTAVSAAELPTASGLFNVVRNVGGSVGIAVTTTWLARQTQVHMATLIGHVTPWSAADGRPPRPPPGRLPRRRAPTPTPRGARR